MIYLLAATAVIASIFHIPSHTPGEWAWKAIGLAGGAVFGGRFFLQWIHSERHGEVRIPTSFWWLSISGTILTCAYIIHIRDWILILSNGPQIIPYSRNLYLIYRKKKRLAEDDEDIA
jgi:lipid-A-disaccharide synthase-like uncharacterized protein